MPQDINAPNLGQVKTHTSWISASNPATKETSRECAIKELL
jgi:hypothetical protein